MSRSKVRSVVHRANGSHKGERIINAEITREIIEVSPGQYIGVRTTIFDQPITVCNGETFTIREISDE